MSDPDLEFCSACGHTMRPGATLCEHCGQTFITAQATNLIAFAPPGTKALASTLPASDIADEPSGIEGWLILVALLMLLAPVADLMWWLQALATWPTEPVVAGGLILLALAGLEAFAAHHFFSKNRSAPRWVEAWIGARALVFLGFAIYQPSTGVLSFASRLIAAAIWVPYLRTSRRVRNTFVGSATADTPSHSATLTGPTAEATGAEVSRSEVPSPPLSLAAFPVLRAWLIFSLGISSIAVVLGVVGIIVVIATRRPFGMAALEELLLISALECALIAKVVCLRGILRLKLWGVNGAIAITGLTLAWAFWENVLGLSGGSWTWLAYLIELVVLVSLTLPLRPVRPSVPREPQSSNH